MPTSIDGSILDTIKPLLNVDVSDTAFDLDIIIAINSALNILKQLGVGPKEGFRITGSTETWGGFLGTATNLEVVKDYVYMKAKLIFDPPTNATVLNSYKELIHEFEWRANVEAEKPGSEE